MKTTTLHCFIFTVLFALVLICFDNDLIFGQTWVQKGASLNGLAASDFAGYTVEMNNSGNLVAMGCIGNTSLTSGSGYVRIFEWTGSWIQKGSTIYGEAAMDHSGDCIDISDDSAVIAIGASWNDGNGNNSGHVRVYSWSGSTWVQKGSDLDGETANDESGFSVSLSADGNTVAIGARYNDGNGSNSGHVRVYVWNGISWAQKGIDVDGEAAGDFCGSSVSLSSNGNILAVGASANDGNGTDAGHVRTYIWDGSIWTQMGNDIDGASSSSWFGFSVDLNQSGNRIAIGGPANSNAGQYAGYAQIYEWDGSGWQQLGSDIDGKGAFDNSGWSVKLSEGGDTVAVGAPQIDLMGNGYAHIYKWDGLSWIQLGSEIIGQTMETARSVSLSGDGAQIMIGDHLNNTAGTAAGQSRVYSFSPSVSVSESALTKDLQIFPNPGNGPFILHTDNIYNTMTFSVRSIHGEKISVYRYSDFTGNICFDLPFQGIYIAEFNAVNSEPVTFRIIKM